MLITSLSDYLVELYLPREGAVSFDAAAKEAAAAAANQRGVRYVRSYYAASDETCFHVYRASSARAIEELLRHLSTPGARATRVVGAELVRGQGNGSGNRRMQANLEGGRG